MNFEFTGFRGGKSFELVDAEIRERQEGDVCHVGGRGVLQG